MIDWKPIKDAPRDGRWVLLTRSGYPVVEGMWSEKRGAWLINELVINEYNGDWKEDAEGPTHYAEITPVPEVKP